MIRAERGFTKTDSLVRGICSKGPSCISRRSVGRVGNGRKLAMMKGRPKLNASVGQMIRVLTIVTKLQANTAKSETEEGV